TAAFVNALVVYPGAGGGLLGSPVSYATEAQCAGLAIADVNGDGRPDMACAIPDIGAADVFVSQPDGGFVRTSLPAGPRPLAVGFGDIDRDGHLDLLVLDAEYDNSVPGPQFQASLPTIGRNAVLLLHGNGDGTFAPRAEYRTGSTVSGLLVVGDLNGDSWPDF